MLWRHLCLVRAWSAAGLLGGTLLGAATPAWADADESSPRPVPVVSETVSVLDARKAGDLAVEVRGAGQDRVKMTLRNTSAKRLNVVVPPGLVASSAAGQGRGGGGGFQSMGLGSVSNRPGSFGEFRAASSADKAPGFRSVNVTGDAKAPGAVAVPPGQTVELSVVSVCLNYGIPTPTPRDKFELVDVEDYSVDVRVRKALRSLAAYGTSQGVAQAVMWRVCNDVPFAVMIQQQTKTINVHEALLASRFVEAVDATGSNELVDPAYLQDGRLFVRVVGEGTLAKQAERLSREMEGLKVLGLPVRVVTKLDNEPVSAPAMLVNVVLTGAQTGETRCKLVLQQADASGQWAPLGKTSFVEGSTVSVLDGLALARAVDRSISSTYVTIKPARRAVGTTTFKVENRLPFTLSRVSVKAGNSAGAPTVDLNGLGVAPARSALVPVQTPSATVEHVEFNGL